MSSSHQDLDAICGALLGISTVVVVLRYYSRIAQDARFQADDWLMIPSYLLFVGWITSIFYGTHHRVLGYSTEETKAKGPYPKVGVGVDRAIETLAAAYFGCIKASALFFFQRVLCVPGKIDAFRIAIWILLVLTFLWSLAYIAVPILQCGTHISAAWSSAAVKAEYCHIANPYLESQSITDAVFDFIILALPVPKIWSLKATFRRRIAVILVFSTAAVSLGASIAKTIIVFSVTEHKATTDPLVTTSRAFFIWILEGGFAIVAVNLPTLIWLSSSRAPEKMLASMRSFLSLRNSQKGGEESPGTDLSREASTGESLLPSEKLNQLGLTPNQGITHKSYVVANEAQQAPPNNPNRIQVTSDVTQQHTTV